METRSCTKCGETKTLSEFYERSPGRPDAECKECRRARARAYREQNLEVCRARELEYARANAEKKRENARRWYHSSPENRAKAILREKAKYERDPEYKRDRAHQTRARGAGASIVEFVRRREVYERDQGVCHVCEKHVAWDDYDMDHVVPLGKGGDHTYANVKVAHAACNRARGVG